MTTRRWIAWGIACAVLCGAFVMQGDLLPGIVFGISSAAAFSQAYSMKGNS
jgi:hypothetical protein